MSDYRRAYVPGESYFFTVVTHRRQPIFADDRHVERLREGFRRVMDKRPFQIDAIVILPDHLHTVWRLPDGNADFSLRWRLIKHDLASGCAGAEPGQRGRGPGDQRGGGLALMLVDANLLSYAAGGSEDSRYTCRHDTSG